MLQFFFYVQLLGPLTKQSYELELEHALLPDNVTCNYKPFSVPRIAAGIFSRSCGRSRNSRRYLTQIGTHIGK
jgi:hypothetical protein